MNHYSGLRRPLVVALLVLMGGLPLLSGAQESQAPVASAVANTAHQNSHAPVFAVINGREISTQEYESAFTTMVRQRFYHGQIPENELAAVREEIKSKLVQRVVLAEEAERRGIQPDEADINEALAGYDRRYATSPQWRENRDKFIPEIRKQLAEQSRVALLDKQVRDQPAPSDTDVHAFYEKNPELFTEPEKLRLAVILLAVDPSSPATSWQASREQAAGIFARLQGGASFDDAARMHSSVYASAGGDMGYLHRGMLPEGIQGKIDQFKVGEINEPVDTLEGVAIFKVLDRMPAKQREFADVAGRARELLIRERQETAWKKLIDELVAKAEVKFMYFNNTEQRDAAKN